MCSLKSASGRQFARLEWCLILTLCVAGAGCDIGARDRARQAMLMARMDEERARAAAEEARTRAEAAEKAARQAQDAEAATKDVAGDKSARAPEVLATGLTAADVAEGWIALFDGSTLFGWQPTSKADWQVKDGTIEVSTGEPGLLCTTTTFADYVMRLEFRYAKGTNSGIFLHSPLKPTDPSQDCYELNMAEPEVSPFPTGSFVKRLKSDAVAEPDKWHSFEITAQGNQFIVKLDGQTVLEYDDPAPLKRGFIGLQLNQGAAAFRRIHLKPLSLEPLFNGRDLEGWAEYPQQKSRFSVGVDETLHVAGGRGQLETKREFGDFVLQLACRTNAPNLNSGVFFRCIPGQEMLGYECQIHNGVKDGDRTKPVDCGTGGIFKRQDARRVVADDCQWFHQTLIADGPHVSAWVNGYQVTDWTDTRPADENPRKGLRTAPGTLMLQGHDPTTDIDFRRLQAAELPGRSVPK